MSKMRLPKQLPGMLYENRYSRTSEWRTPTWLVKIASYSEVSVFYLFFFLYQKMLTFSDKKGEEIVYIYNLRQNIYGLFYFLSQLVFITSETKLDYYHQKVNVRVAWRVAERLKDLSQLGNFKKIPEMLGFDGEYPAAPQKAKFGWFLVKNCKKSAVKHSIEKPSFLNFENLSLTLCPRL